MSSLTHTERIKLEKLLEMGSGYVCDFSDRTFRDFVIENTDIDVYVSGYEEGGTSKANRLRTLWRKESDQLSAKIIRALLDYWKTRRIVSNIEITPTEEILFGEGLKIVNRLEQVSIIDIPPDTEEMKRSLKTFLSDSRFGKRKFKTIREHFPVEEAILRTRLIEIGAICFRDGDGLEMWGLQSEDIKPALSISEENTPTKSSLITIHGDFISGDKVGRDKKTEPSISQAPQSWLSKYWWGLVIPVIGVIIGFIINEGKIPQLFSVGLENQS